MGIYKTLKKEAKMAIINAKNIVKTYQMGRETLQALKSVSLTVEKKELLTCNFYFNFLPYHNNVSLFHYWCSIFKSSI